MKNSLFTKVLAWLLCALMVIGYLPNVAFADTWEGEMDQVEPTPEPIPGESAENPYELGLEDNGRGQQVAVTEEQSGLVYYRAYPMGEFEIYIYGYGNGDFTVTIGEQVIASVDEEVALGKMTFNPRAGEFLNFSIEGNGVFTVYAVPVLTEGSWDAPAALTLGLNSATALAGPWGDGMYYYNWTAPADGTLKLSIVSGADDIQMQGPTYQWLSEDGVDGVLEVSVQADETYKLSANMATPVEFAINAEFVEAVTEPVYEASLKFSKALSFQEYVAYTYYFDTTNFADYTDFYFEIVQETPKGNVTTKLIGTPDGNNLVFEHPVLSWSMPDVINATMYAYKDGVWYYSDTYSRSVETMAKNRLNAFSGLVSSDPVYAKYCTVLMDMLNYGAAVQAEFDYNDQNLPNRDTDAYTKYATTGIPTMSKSNSNNKDGAQFTFSYGVSLQSKVTFQVIVAAANVNENHEVRYVINGVETKIPYSAFTPDGDNMLIDIAVKASDFRNDLVVGIYDVTTDTLVSNVRTLSVEAYANTYYNAGYYQDLLVAILRYGDAASALLG